MEKLTREQGERLLELARAVIDNHLGGDSLIPKDTDPVFQDCRGTFVTLKLDNNLRGCIGNIEPVKTIWDSISDNAINAAFQDYRFSPLSREEFECTKISISILTQAEKLSFADEHELVAQLRPFMDGVILRHGSASAIFLPQVWEQLPDTEQFLSHLCLKAGLTKNCWRDKGVEIQVYQVQSFKEEQ